MPEVVGEEADLDKDEGEVNSMQELEPGIVEDEQQGQAHRQKAEGEGQPARCSKRAARSGSPFFLIRRFNWAY